MADVVYVGLQDDDRIVAFGVDARAAKLVPMAETPSSRRGRRPGVSPRTASTVTPVRSPRWTSTRSGSGPRQSSRSLSAAEDTTMKVIPTRAVLGAEIAGVDLSRPLDDATFAAIERAYAQYG